jgi:hypothetical protein
LEIRKIDDDPMELDELILHVHKLGDVSEDKLTRELSSCFLERTEIRPNRVVFHDVAEMRHLLGVGVQLKEQKLVDHRPQISSHKVVAAPDASAEQPASSQATTSALLAEEQRLPNLK